MAKKQTKSKKQNQTATQKISKALQEGNLGDAIEVVAKPIAKAIGMDEDCEGCKARKELLNFGDRHDFKVEQEEFRIMNRFFTSNQQNTFHNKRQGLKFVEINNKYFPKYGMRSGSCRTCNARMVKRMRLLWEANIEHYGEIRRQS